MRSLSTPIKRRADRVYFLSRGEVRESGVPRAVLEEPSTPELRQFVAAIDHGR
jgi:ABC-type histidine transport system ATPase subunit